MNEIAVECSEVDGGWLGRMTVSDHVSSREFARSACPSSARTSRSTVPRYGRSVVMASKESATALSASRTRHPAGSRIRRSSFRALGSSSGHQHAGRPLGEKGSIVGTARPLADLYRILDGGPDCRDWSGETKRIIRAPSRGPPAAGGPGRQLGAETEEGSDPIPHDLAHGLGRALRTALPVETPQLRRRCPRLCGSGPGRRDKPAECLRMAPGPGHDRPYEDQVVDP